MNKWQETKIIFYMFVEFAICTVVLFLDVLYYFITGKERNQKGESLMCQNIPIEKTGVKLKPLEEHLKGMKKDAQSSASM